MANNSQSTFEVLTQYRETDQETIAIDEKFVVLALQSLSESPVTPAAVESDGRKLRYCFEKKDAVEKYKKVQMYLSGVLPEGERVLLDLKQYFLHEQEWIGFLSMMRSVSTNKSPRLQ